MRTGKLYINDVDAYEEYGVFLCSDRSGVYDNLSALLTPPPAKSYVTVNYWEKDGEETEVEQTRYEARDLSLRFALVADSEPVFTLKYRRFLEVVKSGWLELRVTETGKTYRVYYLSSPGLVMKTRLKTTGRLLAIWTIKFREPKPEF